MPDGKSVTEFVRHSAEGVLPVRCEGSALYDATVYEATIGGRALDDGRGA